MLPELERYPLVIVPGYQDSGPEHWQTLWELAHPDARRTQPASFDFLGLDDWVHALDAAIEDCAAPPLVVAHSAGTLATLSWAADGHAAGRVIAILLVGMPDPGAPTLPPADDRFRAIAASSLGVPTAVVASTDDPYADVAYPTRVAELSGATLHVVGALGHLNADSGLGDWPVGQRILADLVVSDRV